MISLGFRFPMDKAICTDLESCQQANPVMKPGVIYEIRAQLKVKVPWIDPSNADKLYIAIQKLRQQYPGVAINYLEIDDSGKNVIIQVFDPVYEGELIAPAVLITIALTIIGVTLMFFVGMAIYYKMTGKQLPPPWPQYPKPPHVQGTLKFPSWGIEVILASLGIVAVAYLLKQLDIRDIVRRIAGRGK